MNALLIRVLTILAAIALLVALFFFTVWILAMLGIAVPQKILTAIFIFLGLIVAIGALTGRFDSWWTR